MGAFQKFFMDKMDSIGYRMTYVHENIESTWMNFLSADDEQFHVMYLKAPMSPEAIRQTFSSHNESVLFVVDQDVLGVLGNDISNMPLWIRALHAIYYGRVYVYGVLEMRAFHFDWANDDFSRSFPIDLNGILFTDTDCKLRDFPGIFHIARFYDRAFWKESEPQKPKGEPWKERARKQREEWEQATKGHAQGNNSEDVYEAFKRAFREHMNSHGVPYDQPPRSAPYQPTGDKWLQGFMSTGNIEAAKTLYRQLSKQYHPDLNPGDRVAEETFKAISVAFSKARDILR